RFKYYFRLIPEKLFKNRRLQYSKLFWRTICQGILVRY
ncbi:hypothetical protein M5D96_011405, partial [Drosophila gunungcola]